MTVPSPVGTGTVPIDNGFLANPTFKGFLFDDLVTDATSSSTFSTSAAPPQA